MIVMPIINKSKNGNVIIHNVEISLKNASKVKEGINLKSYREGDIIINSTSFNDSIYNTKNKKPASAVNFIRNYNYREGRNDFLITTKRYKDANIYDLYNVKTPPKKISAGMDNLYGCAYLGIRGEVPGINKSKVISLKKLGLDNTITEEKIEKLERIVNSVEGLEKQKEIMQLEGVSDLLRIVDSLNDFSFTVISKSKIPADYFKLVLSSFSNINSKEYKVLNNYYGIANENKEVYKKLTRISKIVYGRPIGLIKSDKKDKVFIKKKEEVNEAA